MTNVPPSRVVHGILCKRVSNGCTTCQCCPPDESLDGMPYSSSYRHLLQSVRASAGVSLGEQAEEALEQP